MPILSVLFGLIPKGLSKKFKLLMIQSTIKVEVEKFLGIMVLAGLIGGIIGTQVIFLLNFLESLGDLLRIILGFAAGFAAIELFFYIMILLSIDSKTKKVEEALPDVLQLMSSNIRAGLTTDKALILSGRPEFGPLAEEIKRVGRETMMGRELASALMGTTTRIKSEHLARTMELIVNSIQSGGELGDLLDQTASDLRDQQLIQKEISAGVLMYVIFIFIAIGIGAPALFAVSGFLVELLSTNINAITEQMPAGMDSGGSISLKGFPPGFIEFIEMYSYLALAISSILGGITMALIRSGKAKDGVKYIIILMPVALIVFFIGSYIIDTIFGGMMETSM